MPSIPLQYKKEGVVASAATLNSEYTAIAAASAAIDTDKVRTEALSYPHFQPSLSYGASVIWWGSVENAYGNPTAYTSLTYTPIIHGTDMRLTPNITLQAGDVVRFQSNQYVTDGTVDNADDITAGEFYFQYWWDIGAGYQAVDTMEYPYGLALRPPTAGTKGNIFHRRMGFSHIYIHTGAPITIANIEVRVRVIATTTPTTSVTLDQNNFFAIIVRH